MSHRNRRVPTDPDLPGARRGVGLLAPVLAVALLTVAGGVAVWVDSDQVEQILAAGTVDIELDEVSTQPVDNLAAGDTFAHEVTVRDRSNLALGGLDLTVDYGGAADLADDLQLNVAVCEVDTGQTFADCDARFLVGGPGDTLTFAPLADVEGGALAVDEVLDAYDGGDVAVRVVVQLDAKSDAQAATGALTYAFDAVQRDPIDQT